MVKRKSTLTSLALALLLGSGCVDAKGAFDDFNNRAGTADASTIDGPSGALHDVTGQFLLAAHPSFAPVDQVVLFRADFVLTGSKLDATLRFLRVADRELVTPEDCHPGPDCQTQLAMNQIDVAADGTYTGRFQGTLPGVANPISGTSGPMDVTMSGTIVSTDLICGPLNGTALVPINGSTFAAIRISPETAAADLPTPVYECPQSMPVDAGVDAPIDAPIDAPDKV